MTGTPPVVWKKLDPQELRQKLMGYGEPATKNDDAKSKTGGRGIFQTRSRKRISTAPGSTLPRPFLSDLAISSPISVTKQSDFLPRQITSTQSHGDLSFDRKRAMRRSRSAQGLVGPLSEYKMDMKIKRKPVPRLSGQLPIRTEPNAKDPIESMHQETRLQSTWSPESLPQSFYHAGEALHRLDPASMHLDPYPFFTNEGHNLPSRPHTNSPAPTIPTTFTSGSLNLGLISSRSGSSLASSDIIDTPTKRFSYHSKTTEEMKAPLSLSSRRYGSVGMRLDRYVGEMGSEEDRECGFVTDAGEAERLGMPGPRIRVSSNITREPDSFLQPETSISIINQSLELPHGPAEQPEATSIAPRPGRSAGLFLDLSHLRPFASTLRPVSPASYVETLTPMSDSARLNMTFRTNDDPDYTASSESSFAALRKDSLESPLVRSVRSSIGHAAMLEGGAVGWQASRSHLGNEVGYESDTEEDSEGTKTAVLSAEALAALDETPKASLREDPFVARPTYQDEDVVRKWTIALEPTTGTSIYSGSMSSNIEGPAATQLTSDPGNLSQEQLIENIEPDVVTRSSRGNRAGRLMEDGRASRTGYWDYSIIRGGHATPPPPEFFSAFQSSPKTPTLGNDATVKAEYDSPGRPLHYSPLQRRLDGNENGGERDQEERFEYTKPDQMSTPEGQIKRVSTGSPALTASQRLLKYGIDVLTSPVKLLSPQKKKTQPRPNREESSGLLRYAQDMGRRDRQYSSPSEYDVDDSPTRGDHVLETKSIGKPLSMPLFEFKHDGDFNEAVTTAKSHGFGFDARDMFDEESPQAKAPVSERLREMSTTASGSSKLDRLSHLDIGLRPAEYEALANGTQVAQFNNAPPVFHFPSPPPSDRHQSIFSMLSGSSGSHPIPRSSHGAFLAAHMNDARKQQGREHLNVLEPAVDIKIRSGYAPDSQSEIPQVSQQIQSPTDIVEPMTGAFKEILSSELFVIATPPPRKRCSAFADAESPNMGAVLGSPRPRPQLLTPQRLPLSATIAAHGTGISIISPDRNFPRLQSDVAHESPRSLPIASSHRDADTRPRSIPGDASPSAPLLSATAPSGSDTRAIMHTSSTYRDDIRLRPLHAILDDKSKHAHNQHSFTASPLQSEQEDDMFAIQTRWDDVYCACFGKRIC